MPRMYREHDFNAGALYAFDTAANIDNILEIDMANWAGLRFTLPIGEAATSIAIWDAPWSKSEKSGATFTPANDTAAGAPASVTVAAGANGNSYDLPACCYASAAIKLVGNVAGHVYLSKKG